MTSRDEQVRAAIAEQASEWFVANDLAPLEGEDSAALVAWLKASPQHVEEFLGVAGIARDLHAAGADPEYAVEALLARTRAEEESPVRSIGTRMLAAVSASPARGWRFAAISAATLAVVSLALWVWQFRLPGQGTVASATALHLKSGHGEQRTFRLADNSVLHLNTDSAATVRYGATERQVVLDAGEADFEVMHGGRPFRVLAGPAAVLDLGTRFDVRLHADSTVVTVVEGRVAVEPAPAAGQLVTAAGQNHAPRSVQLGANQQLSVVPGEWPAVPVVVDALRTTAWLHRQIAFDHERLERVAAEFNRYAAKPIEITAPELRDLEVSGVFSTDDPEEFLAFLRSLEGVRVDVTDTKIRVSQK